MSRGFKHLNEETRRQIYSFPFFNDSYEKKEDGHYAIVSSYFSETRLNLPSLSYLKESDVSQKALEGIDLGIYEGEPPYSWYQETMAPYHIAIAEAFLS